MNATDRRPCMLHAASRLGRTKKVMARTRYIPSRRSLNFMTFNVNCANQENVGLDICLDMCMDMCIHMRVDVHSINCAV